MRTIGMSPIRFFEKIDADHSVHNGSLPRLANQGSWANLSHLQTFLFMTMALINIWKLYLCLLHVELNLSWACWFPRSSLTILLMSDCERSDSEHDRDGIARSRRALLRPLENSRSRMLVEQIENSVSVQSNDDEGFRVISHSFLEGSTLNTTSLASETKP
jgi:hypothetical protein